MKHQFSEQLQLTRTSGCRSFFMVQYFSLHLSTSSVRLCGVFKYPYLSKFVYLLDHCSKQSAHTLIDQTLHVVNSLLIRKVQSELILHLMAHKRHGSFCDMRLRVNLMEVSLWKGWNAFDTVSHPVLLIKPTRKVPEETLKGPAIW